MTAERLSRLQRRILRYVYEAEARSRWSAAPSHLEIMRAVAGNKGNVSMSLRNLEAKGLLVVHRTPGGYANTVALTREGKNRAALFVKSFD
jgi:DNA-binding MarR family transcriptional regulator